jgi:hypothetical protein
MICWQRKVNAETPLSFALFGCLWAAFWQWSLIAQGVQGGGYMMATACGVPLCTSVDLSEQMNSRDRISRPFQFTFPNIPRL